MRYTVTDDDTAVALGSGDVTVLGTPRLIAWLEAATVAEAAAHLADGQTTVGAAVRVRHRRPTPVGGTVDVYASLTTDGDRLTFDVSAIDGDGHYVADGEIDRVVVDKASFSG
jgi:fluoroacetyl-CoA thioesterase